MQRVNLKERCVWVVNIRPWRLPMTVRAFTVPDPNGEYNIYVNDRLSDEAREEALEHEYDHIVRGDFESDKTATEIEKERSDLGRSVLRYAVKPGL